MTILIIHNKHTFRGGEETFVELQKQAHLKNNDAVILYSRDSREVSSSAFLLTISIISSIFSLKTYVELKKIIKNQKPEIIFVHNIHPLISGSVYPALSTFNMPIVQFVHNYEMISNIDLSFTTFVSFHKMKKFFMSYLRKVTQKLFIINSKVILAFPSNFMMQKHAAFMNSNKKIIISAPITHTPNVTKYKSLQKKKQSFVLYFGRLSPEKGVQDIVELASELTNEKFLIVGDGEIKKEMQREVKKKSLQNVKFKPFLSGKSKWDLIENAKAVIIPSRWEEPFGLTLIESVIIHTPVIYSNSGAMPNTAKKLSTCFEFEKGNILSLKKSLIHLNKNYDSVYSKLYSSKKKIIARYSVKKYLETLKKL